MYTILSFNEPEGPVPIEHALRYIIIADEGVRFFDPRAYAIMYFYFELKSTTLTANELRRWFPNCHFERNQGSAEEIKQQIRNIGNFVERTFLDVDEDLAM